VERGNGSPLQVTSVLGPLVGDLGPSAHELLELLRDAGRGTGRSFPLNPTAPEHDNSPYSELSAFTGNLIMVNPQLLAEEGLPPGRRSPHSPGARFSYGQSWPP
jgi:4-alpha-glucanotransferase